MVKPFTELKTVPCTFVPRKKVVKSLTPTARGKKATQPTDQSYISHLHPKIKDEMLLRLLLGHLTRCVSHTPATVLATRTLRF